MGLLAALKTWVTNEILQADDLNSVGGTIRDWANTSVVLVDVDALVTAYHRFHAGAQFDAAVDITAGGLFVVGDSEIAGNLTGLTALGVIGPVDIVGDITQTGNQDVTGSLTISGNVDIAGAMNAASITGPFTVPASRVTTGSFGSGAYTFTNGAVLFTNPGNIAGAVRSSFPFRIELSSPGTLSFELGKHECYIVLLSANATVVSVFSGVEGQHATIALIQDIVGGRTFSFGGAFFTGGVEPTWVTTPHARATLEFSYLEGLWRCIGYCNG